MLDFTLLWVVTSEYYHLSMQNKWPTLYVSSSCLITILQFTDTNEWET